MKDQKPFIIGLGLGVLIISGIALSKPKRQFLRITMLGAGYYITNVALTPYI